jgi:ATP-dependent DNA helicase RecG
MPIDITSLTESQLRELFDRGEGHFLDFKSKRLAPGRLTKTLSAFANADGGELYVGIEDGNTFDRSLWNGFTSAEEANGFVQTFEEFFPLGTYFRYQFLRLNDLRGLVLHSEIMKTPDIRPASDGIHYLRRGAQNLPQDTDEKLTRLRFNKGINSYEDFLINAPVEEVANSASIIDFMLDNIPTAEPEPWMRKQQLISDTRPTVAAVLLYADEPQALLPKTGIKIYRYKTAGQGSRDTLTENPITIEGHAYKVIFEAVRELIEIVEGISIMGPEGLEKASYPKESIHEILTNAVLHRDYSLNDEIHLRVFDNRIEVQSPGTLPAHVTVKNILDERFSRNPRIVRLINKYRNPPNKDVGEGLNTAFEAMRKIKLKDPVIEQLEGSVRVTLKHEKLASPEEIICTFLRNNDEINNAKAREITYIGSENRVKAIFQKMMRAEIIARIPGRAQVKTAYQKGPKFPQRAE